MKKIIPLVLLFALVAHGADDEIGSISSVIPNGAKVMVRSASGAIETREEGAPVHANEHILPSSGQTVVVHLKDGSYVAGAPGADFLVTDYSPNQPSSLLHVQLEQGSAHFDVNKTTTGHPSFFIKTKTATMGVRGTEFIVDQRNDGYSIVHTLEGRVALGKTEADLENPVKSVEIPAGHMSYFQEHMKAPSAPKVFNQKEYLESLGKQYPGMMKAVEHANRRRIESHSKNSPDKRLERKKTVEEAQKNRTKRRYRPKKPVESK